MESYSIAVGELRQEATSFSDIPSTRDDFRFLEGEEIVDKYEGTETNIGAFIDVVNDHTEDIELDPIVSARMIPGAGGPVEDDVFNEFRKRFFTQLDKSADAVILSMHGSMLTHDYNDPEGTFLTQLRRTVGNIPVVAPLDHHGHVTQRMVSAADALIGYKTGPHIDIYETGEKAAHLAVDALRSHVDLQMSMVKLPMAIAKQTETNQEPMKGVFDLRAELEEQHEAALDVSFFPVHVWLDVPEMGLAALAVTDREPKLASELAQKLAHEAWNRRERFEKQYPGVDEAIDQVASTSSRPVVISDRGDTVGGGAPGDSAVILRKLLERGEKEDFSAVIPVTDPNAVSTLLNASADASRQKIQVGGELTSMFNSVKVEGQVTGVFKEPYTMQENLFIGRSFDIGTRVVFKLAERDIDIILSKKGQLTFEPAYFEAHGIDPSDKDVVVVKSGMHFRTAFDSIAGMTLLVDTPGPTAIDLKKLPFKEARPFYPLDHVEAIFDQ